MSIQELSRKLKGFSHNTEYLLAGLIVVVSLTSFYLGKLSVGEVRENYAENAQISTLVQSQNTLKTQNSAVPEVGREEMSAESMGAYVASKNGTKYHLPWCGGAKQIKEENKIWFATKEEAEMAGYMPASNCKGI